MEQGHIVHSYDAELESLHQLVVRMAELCRRQLRDAIVTVQQKDVDIARMVIERDREINVLDEKADNDLVHIIARRQPIARDLRGILTVGKIVNDLERVGDIAKRIARLTCHLYDGDSPQPNHHLLEDLFKMWDFVDNMIAKSIESFDTQNLELALEVMQMDGVLEGDFKSALRRLSTYLLEDSRSIGHVTDITLSLRSLERAGGHAKNIASYNIFLVRGIDVRHADLEAIAAEVNAQRAS